MHDLIAQHRADIGTLCRRFGVRRLEVFGSAARGTDFVVEFEQRSDLGLLKQFLGFAEALLDLLGRPVDLVERSTLAAGLYERIADAPGAPGLHQKSSHSIAGVWLVARRFLERSGPLGA
jgi:hypothetical protein